MPVELVYLEEFDRIDWASAREKQWQGWSRRKREALIEQRISDLPALRLPLLRASLNPSQPA